MPVSLIRIDDRLIHGQVATTWVNSKKIEQIVLIDDAVARDKVQKSVLLMTAPVGVKVLVFDVAEAVRVLPATPIKRNTMLILTNSTDVWRLYEGGLVFSELNVGGMRLNGDRKQYTRAVSMNEAEREAFEKLMDHGVKVTVQMVPNDPPEDMKKLIG